MEETREIAPVQRYRLGKTVFSVSRSPKFFEALKCRQNLLPMPIQFTANFSSKHIMGQIGFRGPFLLI